MRTSAIWPESGPLSTSTGVGRIVTHLGSAHTEAELGLLLEQARDQVADVGQGAFDFGIEPSPRTSRLLGPRAEGNEGLFTACEAPIEQVRVGTPRVVATSSRLLFDVLTRIYDDLGFAAVGEVTFRDLVISRIVEPTSIMDTGRVLTDLGQRPVNERTMRRCLGRAQQRGYRDQVAKVCLNRASTHGDVSLCLYDVTTLYFEAEKEDEGTDGLGKVGYSKERRVDPQIVVGLLVDRNGFPLEIGCFEGNEFARVGGAVTTQLRKHTSAQAVVLGRCYGFYNDDRRHSAASMMSPINYANTIQTTRGPIARKWRVPIGTRHFPLMSISAWRAVRSRFP